MMSLKILHVTIVKEDKKIDTTVLQTPKYLMVRKNAAKIDIIK